MNDTKLVKVLNPTDYLLEEPTRLNFFKFLFLDDVIKKLSAADVLHNQEQLLRSFDDLKKLNDVWVSDHLQNVYFPRHS